MLIKIYEQELIILIKKIIQQKNHLNLIDQIKFIKNLIKVKINK